jgi:hypothetical protein
MHAVESIQASRASRDAHRGLTRLRSAGRQRPVLQHLRLQKNLARRAHAGAMPTRLRGQDRK